MTLAAATMFRPDAEPIAKKRFLIKRCPCVDTKLKETVVSDSVGSVTLTQAVAQAPSVCTKAAEPKSPPITTDTVQLSSAAQAALRESTETPGQTANQASSVDKRLLAIEEATKEAAAKEEAANTKHVIA
jgi:hypothetical protein